MAISENERAFIVAGISASAAFTVALLGARLTFLAGRRDRRRQAYGEATKAATVWVELLYRVRRRADNSDDARKIIHRFHDAQEALLFHQGWIGSESRFLARSYDRLVKAVKSATEPATREAWRADLRPVPGDAASDDAHPDVSAAMHAWLKDVRAHMGVRPVAKIGFWWRNRDSSDG